MRVFAPLLLALAPIWAIAATAPAPVTAPPGGVPIAQSLVQPAQFATGVLTSMDRQSGTMIVGNETYYVRDNAAFSNFQTGQILDVTFLVNNGRREAIALQRSTPANERTRPLVQP